MDLATARENLHKYAERHPELRTVKHKEIVFLGSPCDGIRVCGENLMTLICWCLVPMAARGWQNWLLDPSPNGPSAAFTIPFWWRARRATKACRPMRSIVLATDLAEQALRSAQYAGSIAQDYNARLTMVNVLSPASTAEQQARAEQSTTKKLHQLMPSDCGEWCTLKFEVKNGEIAPAILQSARENKANLIVLGAQTQSTAGRSCAENQTFGDHSRIALPGTACAGSRLLIFDGDIRRKS